MKDPQDKTHWIVDEEVAEVVREIFLLCMEGNGSSQIARILSERKVVIPSAYAQQQGRTPANEVPANRCQWCDSTVAHILERKEYLGHTVNFKTYKESFRNKKQRHNPEKKQMVLRIPMSRLLTRTHGRRCNICASTNDTRRKQEKPICFPGLYTVPTARANCTTALLATLRHGKIISGVPHPRTPWSHAPSISSALLCWKKWC